MYLKRTGDQSLRRFARNNVSVELSASSLLSAGTVPPKSCYLYSRDNGVTSQKTVYKRRAIRVAKQVGNILSNHMKIVSSLDAALYRGIMVLMYMTLEGYMAY
jgi:hypothetical protein